jgi:hypothetical protein
MRRAMVVVGLLGIVLAVMLIFGLGRQPRRLWPTVDAGIKIGVLAESLPGRIDVSGLPIQCSPTPYSGSLATGFAYVLVTLDSKALREVDAYVTNLPEGEFGAEGLGKPRFTDLGSLFVNGSTLAVASGDCRSA